MRFATDVGDIAIWAACAGLAIWIVQYSILARWWRNVIGVTLVGLAVVVLAIYIPSLMALADPHDFARFASTTWYQWLAITVVVLSAAFIITRIIEWERIRRSRDAELPAHLKERIAELEAENERLREEAQ